MSCAASVNVSTMPVSSVGMKPWGSFRAMTTVSTAITTATSTITRRCRKLARSVRS